jgi:hypothetical protein
MSSSGVSHEGRKGFGAIAGNRTTGPPAYIAGALTLSYNGMNWMLRRRRAHALRRSKRTAVYKVLLLTLTTMSGACKKEKPSDRSPARQDGVIADGGIAIAATKPGCKTAGENCQIKTKGRSLLKTGLCKQALVDLLCDW